MSSKDWLKKKWLPLFIIQFTVRDALYLNINIERKKNYMHHAVRRNTDLKKDYYMYSYKLWEISQSLIHMKYTYTNGQKIIQKYEKLNTSMLRTKLFKSTYNVLASVWCQLNHTLDYAFFSHIKWMDCSLIWKKKNNVT